MPRTKAEVRLRRLAPISSRTRLDDLLSRRYEYRGWEDVYREQWTWDDVVHVSHLRTNCISACSLDAYVKDGIVWREEQNANYEQAFEDVPDFNPRGCPSGCAYSVQMYDPTRIRYPLKRVGERGSGKWQRLSWDQALAELADKLIDTIFEHGAETIVYDHGTTNIDNGIGVDPRDAPVRLDAGRDHHRLVGRGGRPAGGPHPDVGHLHVGGYVRRLVPLRLHPHLDRQPVTTRGPADAHFIWEARYRGAKVVAVAPDFSPSTPHADRWLNVRFGTDAALALGMVNVILDEGLYDEAFIKEQTDLPFLVREDDGRFLRESDLVEGGVGRAVLLLEPGQEPSPEGRTAPGRPTSCRSTLAADEDPALEGTRTVKLLDGTQVKVRPVFELLREHVQQSTRPRPWLRSPACTPTTSARWPASSRRRSRR